MIARLLSPFRELLFRLGYFLSVIGCGLLAYYCGEDIATLIYYVLDEYGISFIPVELFALIGKWLFVISFPIAGDYSWNRFDELSNFRELYVLSYYSTPEVGTPGNGITDFIWSFFYGFSLVHIPVTVFVFLGILLPLPLYEALDGSPPLFLWLTILGIACVIAVATATGVEKFFQIRDLKKGVERVGLYKNVTLETRKKIARKLRKARGLEVYNESFRRQFETYFGGPPE